MPNLSARFLKSAGRIQSDGQHHHIEFFLFDAVVGGGIPYGHILGFRDLSDNGDVAPDKPNSGKFLGPLVEPLEILAIGTNIVMEYGALRLRVMIFGQNHLFLGIGAADGGAIAVVAGGNPSGTDALNPGYFMGMLLVGSAQDLAFIGPGGAQQPFIVHTGDHVLSTFRSHSRPCTLGSKGSKPGRQNDRPDFDFHLFRLLIEIDGVVLAYPFADTAFLLFQVKAAFVNIGDQGNRLRKIDMDGLIGRYFLIEIDRDILTGQYSTQEVQPVHCSSMMYRGFLVRVTLKFPASPSTRSTSV